MSALKWLIVLALVIAGVVVVAQYTGGDSGPEAKAKTAQKAKQPDDKPALEERYGFTSQQVGP